MNKGFIVFFAVFILCMAILPPGPAYAQDLDQELENVKNQREETSKQIEQTKQDEQAYIGEIEQIEDNMLDVLDVLEELSRELDHIRMQVQKTSLELELAHKEMEDIEKELQDTLFTDHTCLRRFYGFIVQAENHGPYCRAGCKNNSRDQGQKASYGKHPTKYPYPK